MPAQTCLWPSSFAAGLRSDRRPAGSARTDLAVAALLAGAALLGYTALTLRLAQGQYYAYYNLAFDFDASRVVSLLTGSPPDPFGFKHPFMLLFRPLGLALLAIGVPAKAAAGLVMAGAGAIRVALVFLFLRAATVGRAEAAALAGLFAVTSTQLVTAMVTETYGFASLTLILVWLLAQIRLRSPGQWRGLRDIAAVMAAGVTITNVMQPFLAEALVAWRAYGPRGALLPLVRFGVRFGVIFAAVALLLWPVQLWNAAQHPISALHDVWWMQTKGPTTGLGKVLETILGFSFVSPDYSVVPLPETTRMIDFREWSFPGPGAFVAAAWLVVLGVGACASLAHPTYRATAIAISVSLLLNIWFHLGFQFRGSVYIYTAHTHFLAFALASGSAVWVGGRKKARLAYVAAVVALTAAVAAINLPMAVGFAGLFDSPDTHCPAPCADGLP